MLYTHCTAKSEAIKAGVHCSLHRIRLLLHHRPVRKMESAKVFVFLGLAATASALACSKSIDVDGGRGQFKTCLEFGSGCITAHISYPGIAPDPTIEFCEGQNPDGSKCFTAESDNICSDILLLTTLKMPTPDLKGTLEFRAGFQRDPAKVCFSEPTNECSSGSSTPTVPEPTTQTAPPQHGYQLSEEDRMVVVDHHNYLRQHVTPSASNMKKMEYDTTLERFAQAYLDGLSTCPLQHNPNNGDYGENVYLARAGGGATVNVDYEHIIQLFYDEVAYYNFGFNMCRAPEGLTCGHFTQVVWDNTEKVGCGLKICEDGDRTSTLVVCNYSPAGNVNGGSTVRRPYTSGQPCTRCPSTHPSCQNSLCAKSGGMQAQEQWKENLMKILSPEVGLQEWEMGSKENDGEKAAELAENQDSGEIKVTQDEVQGDGWTEYVV